MTQSKGLANRSRDEWAGVLSAALLFLRNHYEVGPQSPEARREVLALVDRVLTDNQPTGVDMETFRAWYPT